MMDQINAADGGVSSSGDAQQQRDADLEFRRLCSDFTLQTKNEGSFL